MSAAQTTPSDLSVLIVSHGSREEPSCYDGVIDCGRELNRRRHFRDVAVGFHKQSPSLKRSLDALQGSRICVVPYLCSAGFFASQFMPKKLGLVPPVYDKVVDLDGRQVLYTQPVGTDRRMQSVVERVAERTRRRGEDERDGSDALTLVIVGHGTPRHPASGRSVRDCVAYLRQKGDYDQVMAAFVDEEPFLDSVRSRAIHRDLLVVPYFVANGPHVTGDIPQGLGIEGQPGGDPHEVGEHRIWFAPAVGLDESVWEIACQRALDAAALFEAAPTGSEPNKAQ